MIEERPKLSLQDFLDLSSIQDGDVRLDRLDPSQIHLIKSTLFGPTIILDRVECKDGEDPFFAGEIIEGTNEGVVAYDTKRYLIPPEDYHRYRIRTLGRISHGVSVFG